MTLLVGFSPVPLAIASSFYLAFPYIVALVGVGVTVAVLLLAFPFLRRYRGKKVLIYVAILFAVALLVFQVWDVPRRSVLDFRLASDAKIYEQQRNQVVVSCQNHGDRAASFYLILSCTNASFQVENQPNYVQINSRAVKVPFSLSQNGLSSSGDSKPVFFTVDANVSQFTFSLSPEIRDYDHLVVSSAQSGVSFVWNMTENCFLAQSTAFGFA